MKGRPAIRRAAALVLLLVLAPAAGCSSGGDEQAARECGAPGPAMSGRPELPDGFPTPDGVTYTGSREAGPSTIVEGHTAASLEDTFEAYRAGFEEVGYDVTKEEQEANDAEVNFAGGGTDGQVRLGKCEDRTSIQVTIRPV